MGALDLLDLCLVNYKNVRDISLLLHSSLIHFLAAQVLNQRRTLFFVSHNERDLRRFCSRGLYIDKGELVIDGPIGDVLARYNADYGS